MVASAPFPFRKFWAGIFSVYIGDQVLLFAVPLLIYSLTGSVAQAGLAYFVEWLPRVLFLPYGGVLVDRLGIRRVLLATDMIKAVSCVVAFALVGMELGPIAVVLGLFNAVLATGNAQTVVAADSIVASTYAGDEFSRRQASIQKADQISMVVGPVLAAGLSLLIGIKLLLVAAAVFYLLNYLNILLILRRSDAPADGEAPSVGADLKAGLAVVRHYRILLLFSAVAALNNMVIGLIEAAGAAIVTGQLDKPEQYFSFLNIVAGLNGVFALSLVPLLLRHMSARTMGTLAFVVLCLGGFMANLADGFWPFLIGFGLIIGSTLLLGNYFRTVRAALIPRAHMGKAIGLLTGINQMSLPLSGLILAWLGDTVGPQAIGLAATVALLAVGSFVLLLDPWVRPASEPALDAAVEDGSR